MALGHRSLTTESFVQESLVACGVGSELDAAWGQKFFFFQNEPESQPLSALDSTKALPKISTEPKEPESSPLVDPGPQLAPTPGSAQNRKNWEVFRGGRRLGKEER